MTWGSVELEPEVRDWLEDLPTAQFMTAAFYIDLLAEQGALLGEPYTRQLDGSSGSCGSTGPGPGPDHLLDRPRPTNRAVDRVHQDPDARGTADRAGPHSHGPMHRRTPHRRRG